MMTYEEFVCVHFGWEIDINDLSHDDDIILSTEYEEYCRNNKE